MHDLERRKQIPLACNPADKLERVPRFGGNSGYPIDSFEGMDTFEFAGVIGYQGNS